MSEGTFRDNPHRNRHQLVVMALSLKFWLYAVNRVLNRIRGVFSDYELASNRKSRITPWVLNKGVFRGANVSLNRGSRIVLHRGGDPGPAVILGDHTYVGRNVELGVGPGNQIILGAFATINDNTVILGDVKIGRYCIFSSNIFISSGNHHATCRPSWLIRDQDEWVGRSPDLAESRSRPVSVGEDVWIGWGVVVKSGIHIGRGAVIGANSVVTQNVPPYSIQAGAPNREIKRRLAFDPPSRINAMDEAHRPYFYAGFKHLQSDVSQSLRDNVIGATSTAQLVLRGGAFSMLRIQGRFSGGKMCRLAIDCNGVLLGEYPVSGGSIDISLSPSEACWSQHALRAIPDFMRNFNVIDIALFQPCDAPSDDRRLDLASDDSHYGLTTAWLE